MAVREQKMTAANSERGGRGGLTCNVVSYRDRPALNVER